jgi:phospholipid/cholesterol/gamma-HCH transport system permease protein
MTGLILAASVGSAIAAQMGTMVVQDEVVALEMMAIDPVRFLVMPRMVALAIVTPLLGFYCCVMGILGGGIVAQTQLHIAWEAYWDGASRWVQNKDISVGLLKSFIFGVIITITACHQGFLSQQGAVGVAHATRRTVVISFLLVLVVGYFVTRVFYV